MYVLKIHDYLLDIYGPSKLLPFDAVHLFKLLRLTKMSIVGINRSLALLPKIPILKPFVANYFTIYPLLNNNDRIILPPKNTLSNSKMKNYRPMKIAEKLVWPTSVCNYQ